MSTANQPPKIACPHCQALIKAPALAAGSLVNCPKCGQGFRLGEGSGFRVQGSGAEDDGRKAKVEGQAIVPTPPPPPALRPAAKPRPVPPPPPKEAPVPRSFASAAAITQPAHRPPVAAQGTADRGQETAAVEGRTSQVEGQAQTVRKPRPPDNLVDPNLLLPPPPREKPKATEVAVVCMLCGTRSYAPLDKIGQTIKCPDCHSVNEVIGPKVSGATKKPSGPTLEGVEDYGLSQDFERPKYRPLVATRGEYEVLSALDPAAVEHGWTLPDAKGATATQAAEGEEEVRLSAPVERIEIKPPPIKLPEPDPEEEMYNGRYDDGLIGDNVDRKQPEAWKKAPFVIGIVEFLFYLSTIPRWMLYSAGFVVVVILVRATIAAAVSESFIQGLAIVLIPITTAMIGLWAPPFFAVLMSIAEDTANGLDEVISWPDMNFFEWLYKASYFPVAFFFSGLPGIFVTVILVTVTGLDPQWGAFAAAAPVLLSWGALTPIVLSSMLTEGSMMAAISPDVFRAMRAASGAWMLFYMYSILLLMLAAAAAAFTAHTNWIVASLGACGLVTMGFLYARLLGRLLWYAGEQEAKQARREAVQRAA